MRITFSSFPGPKLIHDRPLYQEGRVLPALLTFRFFFVPFFCFWLFYLSVKKLGLGTFFFIFELCTQFFPRKAHLISFHSQDSGILFYSFFLSSLFLKTKHSSQTTLLPFHSPSSLSSFHFHSFFPPFQIIILPHYF